MQSVFSLHADPNDNTDPTAGGSKRRRREVLACAECRRLKLKCDRTWPCYTCTRRGCAAICPTGSLAPGRQGRIALTAATSSPLHERIASLCDRVRSLEDALEQIAGVSHPLLGKTLRELKAPQQGERRYRQDGEESRDSPPTTDGGSERGPQAVVELAELGRTFPLPVDEDDLLNAARSVQDIRGMLPPVSEAHSLVKSFYEGFGVTFTPVPKAIFARILNEVYELPPGRTDLDFVHKLALVFLTFAIAHFYDIHHDSLPLGQEPSVSETYFSLSKALFCIRSCFESNNDVTVYALLLVCNYCRLTNRNSTTWTMLGVASKLALANNLHRDPARWGLRAEISSFRRLTFWEVYTFDTFYALCSQRVPMYNIAFVDCPFPDLDLDSQDQATRTTANFLWKYRYTSEIVPKLMEEMYGRKTPTYTTILEMDRMIRESWIPDCLQPDRQNPVGLSADGLRTSATQRFSILWCRELSLMLLHRTLLAIAMTESPHDPLQHRFSPSVLASFRSAYKLISALRALAEDPETRGLHIFFYQPGFSAITVLGSMAVLIPSSTFGQAAAFETLKVCELYETSTVPVPPPITTWLQQLKGKVQQAQQGTASLCVDLCAPDWDQFGADESLISTRARTSHVARKEPHQSLSTSLVDSLPASSWPPVPAAEYHQQDVDVYQPEFLAPFTPFTNLQPLSDSLDTSILMNEPITLDYFPPLDQAATSIQCHDLALSDSQHPPPIPLAGRGCSDADQEHLDISAHPPHDAELSSQWARFLASIGLSES